MHEKTVQALIEKLNQADNVALTADLWTSINNLSFITVTCHSIINFKLHDFVLTTRSLGDINHGGENLSRVFKAEEDKWNLNGKVVGMTTDNARNITNAVKFADNDLFRCTAHTLQLCIHDALDENLTIKTLLDKCRASVVSS
jgi:hypothetical protein